MKTNSPMEKLNLHVVLDGLRCLRRYRKEIYQLDPRERSTLHFYAASLIWWREQILRSLVELGWPVAELFRQSPSRHQVSSETDIHKAYASVGYTCRVFSKDGEVSDGNG